LTDDLDTLLSGARRRSPEALAALCERVYPRVLRYMRYRVGATHAEDLTEEVFLRVVRSIHGQSGTFEAWLYRIAGNVVVDWLRARRVREPVRSDTEAVERAASTDRGTARADARLDLADALERLTDEQRELVTLKFIEGLSNDQVGEITGRSAEAVRALQFRALAALRTLLSDEEETDERESCRDP
jgi:RNA polymerase sigma-70 factor (ECF subfamily)